MKTQQVIILVFILVFGGVAAYFIWLNSRTKKEVLEKAEEKAKADVEKERRVVAHAGNFVAAIKFIRDVPAKPWGDTFNASERGFVAFNSAMQALAGDIKAKGDVRTGGTEAAAYAKAVYASLATEYPQYVEGYWQDKPQEFAEYVWWAVNNIAPKKSWNLQDFQKLENQYWLYEIEAGLE